jgi:hypothetical protein
MLRLNQRQRALLADKLFDFGNLAAGALVFGQFIGDKAVSLGVIAVGVVAWVSSITLSLLFSKEKKP